MMVCMAVRSLKLLGGSPRFRRAAAADDYDLASEERAPVAKRALFSTITGGSC